MLDLDPSVPGFFLRPDYYEVLAQLRDESPVHECASGMKLVSRYHDIREISRDPERFCSGRGVLVNDPVRSGGRVDGSILHMDPPEHRQWRRILNREFTNRALQAMETVIRARAIALVEAIPRNEEVDLVEVLAAPLPVLVIADVLGVPETDRSEFRRWSDATIVASDGTERLSEEELVSVTELVEYLQQLARDKAAQPGDDVVSLLVTAEIDGRKLGPHELLMFNMSLLVAGNETTRHLISGGLLTLGSHPEQWQAMVADRDLVPGAVEECLRWVTPIQQFARTATRDTELAGTPIAAGDYVVMLYASGNRDERAFGETANRFDVTRGADPPNLAFGFGEHLCLGAALARMEARILFEVLLDRTDGCQIVGPGEWLPSSLVRGPDSLPVVFAA